ncbi:hypothetical protein HN840_01160 [archaeon]|jgi:hypothetical protein|nr:hypothetical protein [archaeon]MBT5030182.1 hypothetical protein [archaeon]MBT5287699.1 hypothetical protein [archaeon]MBT7052856.1 hypothetical protein [archaeon]MBT7280916.1 hypothetical protein [archaeon]
MKKKGQMTLFIILGIVLIILIGLYFVGVKTNIIPPLLTPSDANSEMKEIEEHIEDCLEEVGMNYLYILGQQGGYLNPGEDTYKMFNDSMVSYLCWNQENSPTCTNRLITLDKMEEQLEDSIGKGLETCINVYDYSNDVEVNEDWELDITINYFNVDFNLDYPVSVVKGEDDSASEDEFGYEADVALGEIYEVTQDIVNQHASLGEFDQLLYMLSKLSRYTIYKNRPYPDVIYQVKLREKAYVFQFGIQGEENV